MTTTEAVIGPVVDRKLTTAPDAVTEVGEAIIFGRLTVVRTLGAAANPENTSFAVAVSELLNATVTVPTCDFVTTVTPPGTGAGAGVGVGVGAGVGAGAGGTRVHFPAGSARQL